MVISFAKLRVSIALAIVVGGFTLGYQWSEQDLGSSANEQQYDNEGYGITFNVNDDLSIGYNNYESERKFNPKKRNKKNHWIERSVPK